MDRAELRRLAFGSCRKQNLKQPIWDAVAATEPELWLWTGDAVYPQWPTTPELLREALRVAEAHEGYRGMLSATALGVEGVYDDHDFGENDGGRHYPHREASRRLFLDEVLRAPPDSPRRSQEGGMYAVRTFGAPPQQVKLLMLDTRYSRDYHALPSVGAWRLPKPGYFAALERLACAALGVGRTHTGDVLGEAQWAWLRRELTNSTAAAHLIVSSIQVLTANPVVESWGHFPASQQRLLRLLEKTAPAGALLLSGDVHFAELIGPRGALLEVTSSGLTHSAGLSGTAKLVSAPMLRLFSRHRLPLTRPHPASFLDGARPHDGSARDGARAAPPDLVGGSSAYSGLNFGTIDFEWGRADAADGAAAAGALHIRLRDVHGSPVMEHRLGLGLGPEAEAARWRRAQSMPSLFDAAADLRDRALGAAGVLAVLLLALRRGCAGRRATVSLRTSRSFASKSV